MSVYLSDSLVNSISRLYECSEKGFQNNLRNSETSKIIPNNPLSEAGRREMQNNQIARDEKTKQKSYIKQQKPLPVEQLALQSTIKSGKILDEQTKSTQGRSE